MTKPNALSRRKLLGRIGLLAAAGYTVPALTTLSVAHAGSDASASGSAASNSGPSGSPTTPPTTTPPTTTTPDPAVVEAACGVKDMNDPLYVQCLVTNGF